MDIGLQDSQPTLTQMSNVMLGVQQQQDPQKQTTISFSEIHQLNHMIAQQTLQEKD